MSLTQSYEPQRDLLTGMAYHRGSTLVAQRTYTYDTLGRPLSRSTARSGQTVNDTFGYNNRSELTTATVNGGSYAYDYDNIGNRAAAVEDSTGVASRTTYTANELNQYTALAVDGVVDFQPEYDADGNQTRVKTSTGIWAITYDTENRPTDFTSMAADKTITTVHCEYDSMGRRAIKRVMVNGNVTLHQRYIYRGYLQIACIDLTRSHHPALWYITWDPTQQIATRPLALQKDGTWYTYGWDLTKTICEVYRNNGTLGTSYTYTPYGQVSASGSVEQPIQWSSEFNDTELGLVYYNYRHYNPTDGRWMGTDPVYTNAHTCIYVGNAPVSFYDVLGLLKMIMQNSPDEIFQNENDGRFSIHWLFELDNNVLLNEYVYIVQQIIFSFKRSYCCSFNTEGEYIESEYHEYAKYWEAWLVQGNSRVPVGLTMHSENGYFEKQKALYHYHDHWRYLYSSKFLQESCGSIKVLAVTRVVSSSITGDIDEMWIENRHPLSHSLPSTTIMPPWWQTAPDYNNEKSIITELNIDWDECEDRNLGKTQRILLMQNGIILARK